MEDVVLKLLRKHNINGIERLLEHESFDVNLRDKGGWSPIGYAAYNLRMSIFTMLFACSNIVLSPIEYIRTAVFIAAGDGYTAIFRMLLACSETNINYQPLSGWTPLIVAIRRNNIKILKILLSQSDINVNLQTRNGETALMFAAKKRDKHILKLMLPDIDSKCYNPATFVELLLARSDIDVDIKNDSGDTALVCAAKKGIYANLRLLLIHAPTKVEIKDGYDEVVKKMLTNWKLYLPRWRCRGKRCKIYPKEFKDIAVSWIFAGKHLNLPNDVYHLILEYIADVWKRLPDEEIVIEPTKKRIKINDILFL